MWNPHKVNVSPASNWITSNGTTHIFQLFLLYVCSGEREKDVYGGEAMLTCLVDNTNRLLVSNLYRDVYIYFLKKKTVQVKQHLFSIISHANLTES